MLTSNPGGLLEHLAALRGHLAEESVASDLVRHGCQALKTFDLLSNHLSAGDTSVVEILDDSRNELLDAYVAALTHRTQASFILLRGVMEGLFSVLFYREQSISLQLWAAGKSFEMLHSMLDSDHEFHKFFKHHFESERFRLEYPEVTGNSVFKEAEELYKVLSSFVHKKSSSVRGKIDSDFSAAVERTFRIFLAFAERIEDLPSLEFPAPYSFCRHEQARKLQRKSPPSPKAGKAQGRLAGSRDADPVEKAMTGSSDPFRETIRIPTGQSGTESPITQDSGEPSQASNVVRAPEASFSAPPDLPPSNIPEPSESISS